MGPDALSKPQVLVVDDDEHIRELCQLYLENGGFQVLMAADGSSAVDFLEQHSVDCVVLDIMLPGIDGYAVLEAIRQRQAWLPVIMLTAVGDEEDRVYGLELGADDYLIKPFSPKELVARVRAVLRRATLPPVSPDNHLVRFPGLQLDYDKRQAVAGGQHLTLTPREFELLWFFAQHPGQVLSRDQLLDNVWGWDFEGDGRTVDVHMARLRQKLLHSPAPYEYLETVWGQGYRFQPVSRTTSS